PAVFIATLYPAAVASGETAGPAPGPISLFLLGAQPDAPTKTPRAGCTGRWEAGAGNRNRTYDLRITNAPLYQLSYSGEAGNSSRRGGGPPDQSTSCSRSSRGSANTMSSGLPSS